MRFRERYHNEGMVERCIICVILKGKKASTKKVVEIIDDKEMPYDKSITSQDIVDAS